MNDNRSATSHEFEYTPEACPCTPTYGDCAACGGDHSTRPTYPVVRINENGEREEGHLEWPSPAAG